MICHSHAFVPMAAHTGLTPLEALPDAKVARIACDRSWTRIAIVRHPHARLLSKFEGKIVLRWAKRGENSRAPHVRQDGTNFSSFVSRLVATDRVASHPHHEAAYVDEHFRRQSNFCGMRTIPYEVVHSEELKPRMQALAASLRLDQEPRVRARLAELRPFNATVERIKLRRAYSASDWMRVARFFHEDFVRLGYPYAPHSAWDI